MSHGGESGGGSNQEGIIAVNGSGHQEFILTVGEHYGDPVTNTGWASNIQVANAFSNFQLAYLMGPTLSSVPQNDANADWAVHKINAGHPSGDGSQFIIYLSNVANSTGHLSVIVMSADGQSVLYDSNKISWSAGKIGVTIAGYYPVYYSETDAENASPIGTSHSHSLYDYYSGGNQTYYMPNGLTMGVDQFHGDLFLEAGYTFDATDDSSITIYNGEEASELGRNAYRFDGTSQEYAIIDHNVQHSFDSDFALSFWLKVEGTDEAVVFEKMAPGISNAADKSELSFTVNVADYWNGDGYGKLRWNDSTGNNLVEIFTSNPLDDGLWHHILITRSSNYGNLELFVDSQQTSSRSTSGQFSSDSEISIARSRVTGGTSKPFDGFVDDLKIFSTYFTQADVSSLWSEENVSDPRYTASITAPSSYGIGQTININFNPPAGTYWGQFSIERWNDSSGYWESVSSSYGSAIYSYNITAADSSKRLRVNVEITSIQDSNGNSVYLNRPFISDELQILDLSSTLVPLEKFGYKPVYLTDAEASLHLTGNGSSTSYDLGGQTYYMPNGLSASEEFVGTYQLSAQYDLDSDATALAGIGVDGSFTNGTPQFIQDVGRSVASFAGSEKIIFSNDSGIFNFLDSNGNPDNFAVSFWAKYNGDGAGGAMFISCMKQNEGFAMGYDGSGRARFRITDGAYNASNNPMHTYARGDVINDGSWHHLIFCLNRDSGTAHIFVNGSERSLTHSDFSGLGDISGANALNIGASDWYIDDVKVYQKIIDSQEADYIYNSSIVLDPASNIIVKARQRDSYGDGWTGNYFQIKDSNGGILHSITGPLDSDDSNEVVVDLNLPGPGVYDWDFVAGSYPADVEFTLTSEDGLTNYFQLNNPYSSTNGQFTIAGAPTTLTIGAAIDSYTDSSVDISISLPTETASQTASWAYSMYDYTVGDTVSTNIISSGIYTTQVGVSPGQNTIYIAALNSSSEVIAKTSLTLDTLAAVLDLNLDMSDAAGDGWTGNTLIIRDAFGQQVASRTLDSGYSATVVVQLPAGNYTYELGGGSYHQDVTLSLTKASNGEQLLSIVEPTTIPVSGSFVLSDSGPVNSEISGTASVSGGTITVSASVVNGSSSLAATKWASSLSSMPSVGNSYTGLSSDLGVDINTAVTSNGPYIINIAALSASGEVLAVSTVSATVSEITSIVIADNPFVGDVIYPNVDIGGNSILEFRWEKYDALNSSWSSVLSGGTGIVNYTPIASDRGGIFRAAANLGSGQWVYSNNVTVRGTSQGMVAKYVLSSNTDDSVGSLNGDNETGLNYVYDAEAGRNVLQLDTGSYFSVDSTIVTNMNTSYAFSFRVKPTSFNYDKNFIMLDKAWGATSVSPHSSIDMYFDQNGKLFVTHRDQSGGYNTVDSTDMGTAPLNVWSHFIVTWDGSKINFYLNGTNLGLHPAGDGFTMDEPWSTPKDLLIGSPGGADYHGTTGFEGFQGYVADVMIWSDVFLHSSEAIALFNAGFSSEASIQLTYNISSVTDQDNLMVFVNGDFIDPNFYSRSGETFVFNSGLFNVGDEIYVVKVT